MQNWPILFLESTIKSKTSLGWLATFSHSDFFLLFTGQYKIFNNSSSLMAHSHWLHYNVIYIVTDPTFHTWPCNRKFPIVLVSKSRTVEGNYYCLKCNKKNLKCTHTSIHTHTHMWCIQYNTHTHTYLVSPRYRHHWSAPSLFWQCLQKWPFDQWLRNFTSSLFKLAKSECVSIHSYTLKISINVKHRLHCVKHRLHCVDKDDK